jgi:hypothetical protein
MTLCSRGHCACQGLDNVQVRDLMVYIEAGRSIATAGDDLTGASLLPVPTQQERTHRHAKRR